jgi:osmotically inducible protein OsmC
VQRQWADVGTAKSDDGQINLKFDRPVEMGGKGNSINHEQLFAAGYAACFIGALRVADGSDHETPLASDT